jgi:hypothetical protein
MVSGIVRDEQLEQNHFESLSAAADFLQDSILAPWAELKVAPWLEQSADPGMATQIQLEFLENLRGTRSEGSHLTREEADREIRGLYCAQLHVPRALRS